MVSNEVANYNAQKARLKAYEQVEKDRMRKMNQMVEERNRKFEDTKKIHIYTEKNESM